MFFRPLVPGRRSFSCIDPKTAFFCGVVGFPTCLTGWVNNFWLSFCSVTVVEGYGVVIVLDGNRDVGTTVSVPRTILSTLGRFLLFFQLSALVSVISRFLTVVARWLGCFSFRVCGMLSHSIHMQLNRDFQTIELFFSFEVCNNLFNCSIFQMGFF